MPSFGKRTAFTKNYFTEFMKAFGKKSDGTSKRKEIEDTEDEQGRWKVFAREAVAERGDSLDITWSKDDDVVDAADLPEPEQLAGEAMSELTEALRELTELMGALGAEDEAVAQRNVLAEALGIEEPGVEA